MMKHYVKNENPSRREARILEVRRNKSILYSILCLFVLVLIIIVISKINNDSMMVEAATDLHVTYVSVEIEAGDSLWEIANKYSENYTGTENEFIEDVIRINSIEDYQINAGEYIIIPQYISIN